MTKTCQKLSNYKLETPEKGGRDMRRNLLNKQLRFFIHSYVDTDTTYNYICC